MDRNAKACVDFFDFANGGWFAHDTIPAAYSSSGVGRDMSDRNELAVRSVLDDAMSKRASAARAEHHAQARHVLRDVHGLGGGRA